jgi:hypothetical protein
LSQAGAFELEHHLGELTGSGIGLVRGQNPGEAALHFGARLVGIAKTEEFAIATADDSAVQKRA